MTRGWRANGVVKRSTTSVTLIGLFVTTVGQAACSDTGGRAGNVKEIQRASAGALDVVLLAADDALQAGKNTAVLEFRTHADQALANVGGVNVAASMPMAGMPPMFGTATVVKTADPGRYNLELQLGMAGSWRLDVRWDGPQGAGEAALVTSAR